MTESADLIDSASILVIRDNEETGRLEVLMVRRHHDIDFAGGAYVFPGGKVDPQDADYSSHFRQFPHGYGELVATAIREVFEESGLVIGCPQALGDKLGDLLAGNITISNLMDHAHIKYIGDDIVPFARWLTPKVYSKRFDTRFFIARAPKGQTARPDNKEVVEAVWAEPFEFIEKNRENLMFPTIMNLKLLSHATNVDEAMELARARKIMTVEPKLIDGKRVIDPAAGYDEVDQGNIHPGIKNKSL